ncbi:YcxB family protein [Actinomadura alba]|uniref:YcxB family protein n=1 Tax=Actinomadura alba TaxID=406431 RepID=A0ABR7LY48_9ACTN|nr:YcxB family protein [Actinomadura alba]MBC6469680.1 YcxB family protein [Actinomadura alba]
MDITFSYTPTAEDRRLELKSTPITKLRFWWLVGAPLTLLGIGVLAKLAASPSTGLITGCSALAGAVGVWIMVMPYRSVEEGVRDELQNRPMDEREITLSDAGIRVAMPGMSSQVAWSKVCSATEAPMHWCIAFDAYRTIYLPKRSVTEDEAAQVSRLLKEAVRR